MGKKFVEHPLLRFELYCERHTVTQQPIQAFQQNVNIKNNYETHSNFLNCKNVVV